MGNASGSRIAFEHSANATVTVLVLAHGLEEIGSLLLLHLLDMQPQEFAKRVKKWNHAVLSPLPLLNTDLTALQIDLLQTDFDQGGLRC